MSINWQMDKQKGYIHMMEYYSSKKRGKVLIYATTLMNYENIMLSERIQKQKATLYHSIYMKGPK